MRADGICVDTLAAPFSLQLAHPFAEIFHGPLARETRDLKRTLDLNLFETNVTTARTVRASISNGVRAMSESRSPLRQKPLRHPGQSLDENIARVIDDQAIAPYVGISFLWAITFMEWFSVWRQLPRQPWLFSAITILATGWLILRVSRVRREVRSLRLGRDGERLVGQFLDGLREGGARIFHDVPAEGFNLDHVVISARGIYAVETKTVSKPGPSATVVYDGQAVTVAGFRPDRDPVQQAAAEARWLRDLLVSSTGRTFRTRGVVVYPNWWIESTSKDRPHEVWVLEPKALPKWIENEPVTLSPDEVALAAFHLAQYVRSRADDKR